MKKLLTLTSLALLASAASANATPQASATASAKIVTPISLAKDTDMNFGDVFTGTSAGTIVLSAAGVATAGGESNGPTVGGGSPAAGAYTVTGENGRTYQITNLGSTTITLTADGSSGGADMTVNNLTSSGVETIASGTDSFTIGGTLNVGANQAADTYSGSFNLTVAYN